MDTLQKGFRPGAQSFLGGKALYTGAEMFRFEEEPEEYLEPEEYVEPEEWMEPEDYMKPEE
jgi:hypothetical protein